jgi:hypothetical protein
MERGQLLARSGILGELDPVEREMERWEREKGSLCMIFVMDLAEMRLGNDLAFK